LFRGLRFLVVQVQLLLSLLQTVAVVLNFFLLTVEKKPNQPVELVVSARRQRLQQQRHLVLVVVRSALFVFGVTSRKDHVAVEPAAVRLRAACSVVRVNLTVRLAVNGTAERAYLSGLDNLSLLGLAATGTALGTVTVTQLTLVSAFLRLAVSVAR